MVDEKIKSHIRVWGRNCGTVVGDTLVVVRNSKKHLFYRYNGYGLSILTIEEARKRGATKVQIDVIDTKETLVASFDMFMERGMDFSDQGGHDKQKILPLQFFERKKL